MFVIPLISKEYGEYNIEYHYLPRIGLEPRTARLTTAFQLKVKV